jgi:hypothetical protein
MREHKLYLQPEKCEFEKTRIEYLGVIISHNKVEMDPVKIAGVADWPTPSNKKEVQSFIGFVNLYRHFIPGFSHYARTLFNLTMKDVRFIWGLPQEDSFMKLKELVTSAPVLVLPNDNLPFRLEADGSSIATGVVLSQQNVDDKSWHPICKGTSVCFLTSPLFSYSSPVHMYFPYSLLYHLQGPYLKLMTSRPDGMMTFQKSTHQQLPTSRLPPCSYLSSIGRA